MLIKAKPPIIAPRIGIFGPVTGVVISVVGTGVKFGLGVEVGASPQVQSCSAGQEELTHLFWSLAVVRHLKLEIHSQSLLQSSQQPLQPQSASVGQTGLRHLFIPE